MKAETKNTAMNPHGIRAAMKLALQRWALRVLRNLVWRADEWIHAQELKIREGHTVEVSPLERAGEGRVTGAASAGDKTGAPRTRRRRRRGMTAAAFDLRFSSSLLLFLLFAGIVAANELPDMPTPKAAAVELAARPAAHPFWDRTNRIETAAMFSAGAFDMVQTCHNLARGGREVNLTQSCPKDIGITAAMQFSAIGAGYLLHRTHHHRLERVPQLYITGNSLQGIIFSKVHGAW